MKRLRIVFASGNGYLPEFSGGVQSSTDHLVRQCNAAGHRAWVLAALFGLGPAGLASRIKLKFSRSAVATDHRLGYPVMRAWSPWIAAGDVMRKVRPDVVLVQCQHAVRIGKAFAAHDAPLVVYLRNVEFSELDGDPNDLPGALFIANSQFTAGAYKARFGIDSIVIPPLIDSDRYRTQTTREFVTFINPDPKKGLAKALEIAAACPTIPFLFVESWTLSGERLTEMTRVLKDLPNVTFQRRVDDMRTVFSRTRILLAPSQWEEAWGRVASEAHCSGIPVLGSNRGGLPEAIGPGGTVLDYDAPLEKWVSALRELWSDDDAYRKYSDAALGHMQRPEMNPERQFEKFLSVLINATNRWTDSDTRQPARA
ncbi:glycosyltransferase [Sphingomonas sp. M1A8_2b]